MRFGRLFEGVVVEVLELPPGCAIEDEVGESQSLEYQPLPKGVDVGYTQELDGSWIAPAPTKEKK